MVANLNTIRKMFSTRSDWARKQRSGCERKYNNKQQYKITPAWREQFVPELHQSTF
jgi:hypothetical protein